MKSSVIDIISSNPSKCCGCGACVAACPTHALSMTSDLLGFSYPTILTDKCIKCELCIKTCNNFQSLRYHDSIKVYACASKSDDIIYHSTSGGLFSEFSRVFLNDNGVVFGAKLTDDDGYLSLQHDGIDQLNDIFLLSGSKYIQSETINAFIKAKKLLNDGRKVLFCGTPCQIDGLYGFLQKDWPGLYTIDIACHGVPSTKLYNEYLALLKKKYRATHLEFRFRDKRINGWSHGAVLKIYKPNGKIIIKRVPYKISSFYSTFMNSQLIRESCYYCKYSNVLRPADITLGDYWGINKSYPELLNYNGGQFNDDRGISFVLLNTKKGVEIFDKVKSRIVFVETDLDSICKNNPAMCRPPRIPSDRSEYINMYLTNGYAGIESLLRKKLGLKVLPLYLKNFIPIKTRKKFLRILRNR